MASASRIRIITCPPGEAPLAVRLAWVGLELPVTATSRKLAMTSGVLSAPRSLWQTLARRNAVNLLQAKEPTAAAWWREHCARLLDGKRLFLFPTASCEERP